MQPEDWQRVKQIYELGIATGNATFETSAPSYESWDSAHLNFGRLVCTINEKIVGWTAISAVSSRCVYGGVAEVSIYVDENFRGKGVGKNLLSTLISDSEAKGIWTLQAGIFQENESSIALHQKLGFRIIGFRERVGKLHGVWRNTILLERRSEEVGID